MKYFIFSIDDGTIYDQKVIEIFNYFGIKATFNLNSGLQDFVWYKEDKPVRRLELYLNKDIYKGHEIASHSLTHPYMTMLGNEEVRFEVEQDIENIEKIFKTKVTTFAYPFENFDERTIAIIKHIPGILQIRVSELDTSFRFPIDQFHIKITSWNIDEALEIFKQFKSDEGAKLFVFVAHSYDFEFDNSYDKLKKLCQLVVDSKDIKVITMNELVKVMKC